jgi:hypothetical protein
MRRSSLIWGVILLLLGLLMLADAAGLRFPGGAAPMQFFWPLLLVLAGAWIVLGVLMRPSHLRAGPVDLQVLRKRLSASVTARVSFASRAARPPASSRPVLLSAASSNLLTGPVRDWRRA